MATYYSQIEGLAMGSPVSQTMVTWATINTNLTWRTLNYSTERVDGSTEVSGTLSIYAPGSPICARTNVNTRSLWFSYLCQDKCQHQELVVLLSEPGQISTPSPGSPIWTRTNINTNFWFPYLSQDTYQHQLLVSISQPGQISTPAPGSPIWSRTNVNTNS